MNSERKGFFIQLIVKDTNGEITIDYPDLDAEGIDGVDGSPPPPPPPQLAKTSVTRM